MAKMTKYDDPEFNKLTVGTELFYTGSKEIFGTIVKVLKRDVHVKMPDGEIITRWQKSLAIKMIKENLKDTY